MFCNDKRGVTKVTPLFAWTAAGQRPRHYGGLNRSVAGRRFNPEVQIQLTDRGGLDSVAP